MGITDFARGRIRALFAAVIAAALLLPLAPAAFAQEDEEAGHGGGFFSKFYPLGQRRPVSRLSDEYIPFRSVAEVPPRLKLLFELGNPFLEVGNLTPGFKLPGGAVWQPRLWVFGTYRTALQSFDPGTNLRTTEWVNRFDLFANLQLTNTEKIVLGIRPLDHNRFGQFSGYNFEQGDAASADWNNEFDTSVRTFFFEGDFGSLVPNLDPAGIKPIDYGFTIGRQPFLFQDGVMLNDTLDAFGIIRNNIRFKGISGMRLAALYAWGDLDRNDTRRDPQPSLFALSTSIDTFRRTIEADLIYVDDDTANGDAYYFSILSTQAVGLINTTFRFNSSFAEDADTSSVADGFLVSAEISWTPHSSDDVVYINPFLAIESYTQAGREPIVGGPLAALGIMFASPNLGNFRSELSNATTETAGVAMGYQAFWDDFKRNLILEFAARIDTSGDTTGRDDYAVGFQLQQKLEQRYLVQLDGFFSLRDKRDDAFGWRTELLIQF